MELLEREILALYTNGQASPGDIDEYGSTHAEVNFRDVTVEHLANYSQVMFNMANSAYRFSMDDILRDNALTHAFISCVRTLVQACNSVKGHL